MGARKARGSRRKGAPKPVLPTVRTLPAVNSLVRLRAEGWPDTARSRVEDRTDDSVVVSRPYRAGSELARARPGERLVLHWTTEDALYEITTQLASASEGHAPTWTLVPEGEPRRQQRRESFRLDVTLAAQLGTPTTSAALAQIHDLSEGGLRCTPPADTELAEGDAVWVELPLPDGAVRLDAEVVRVAQGGEIGLRFRDLTESDAEQVRAYLFAEQLARRARLAT